MHASALGKLVAVSPHLDDAVFGCGALLAGCREAVVITVFAGIPSGAQDPTPWDRACGFSDAVEAVMCRRAEDKAALDLLDARAVWLQFLDSQYGASPFEHDIAAALDRVMAAERPQTILIPMGLYHSDHELTHAACLSVRRHASDPTWLLYEDALYRRHPGLLQKRLALLLEHGVVATPAFTKAVGRTKRDAVRAYASQTKVLGAKRLRDTDMSEAFWRIDGVDDG
jgi:LmbE family N-acetylglucosaminyl deacetylase